MKTVFKSIVVIFSVVFLSSFITKNVFTGPKTEPLTGVKQIFVNSTKNINYTKNPLSISSFENKTNDSLNEGFQMYTFDFDKKVVEHHFYDYDENDSVIDKTYVLDMEMIKSNGEFAIFKVTDNTGYYNTVKEKTMIINLKDNPKYPKLQIIWKVDKKYKGVYSVDTRDFTELFNDSESNIFKK